MFVLYHRRGWGSTIVEAELACLGLDYRLEEVGDVFRDPAAREVLERINPLGQVPALVLPSGEAMTESAAITLYLADLTGSDLLVPGPGAPERAAFLRWLVFLVANIYPTFTYADAPEKFVPKESEKKFLEAVDAHREALWRVFGQAARSPFFLGERFSALDIFVAVMTAWFPRRPWFDEHLPALARIADAAAARPELAAVMARNYG